ncbi:hypothetical protein [Streptomyces sp. R41]|uniref:Uncharacterized protein n=1 Tax=Streptomyces sp. R41 TaxID=3238632 RepID=A0AB39RDI7_9ACTN
MDGGRIVLLPGGLAGEEPSPTSSASLIASLELLRALIEAGSHTALFSLEQLLDEQGRSDAATSLLPVAAENGNDHAVVELALRWYRTQPEQARALLERCRRTGRIRVVLSAARLLLKQPWPAARRLAEDFLNHLAQDGSTAAQMTLATWQLDQWQQSEPAAGAPVPPVILTLVEQTSAHVTEARRLLGLHALTIADTVQADHCRYGAGGALLPRRHRRR